MTTRRAFLVLGATLSAGTIAPVRFACAAQGIRRATRAATVQTVLGPLDAAKLGFTLTHEHVGQSAAEMFGGRAHSVADAVERLKEAKDAGIDTVVDVTTFDIGRDIRFREEISRKSGMHIVVCTGQHLFAPESLNSRGVDEITELFVREIEQGIDGTDIKAGVIKVAARSEAMTAVERNIFEAAARASKATGTPIATHTHARRRAGEQQAEVFEAEGVSPARVCLGHSDDADDMDYLMGLIKRGYTLGMDHIHRGNGAAASVSWRTRTERIKQLIDAGFVDRIFLSNDWVHGDAQRARANPDGLLFNTRKTIPYLKEIGVTQQQVDAITIDNPRRFLGRG
jgi:phosphotriesterase-related protein